MTSSSVTCISSKDTLMIGDTISDYNAAKSNNINFIFRKTEFNGKLIKEYNEKFIQNFNNFL